MEFIMPSIDIRPAEIRDLPTLLDLYAVFESDGSHLSIIEAERLFRRMQSYPNYTVYSAWERGKIIGTFALLIMDNLAHNGAPSAVVEDVVVHADYRSQGVGKQMMQFAMQQCWQAGCYKLALSSNMKRERAHKFYEELGFEKHGFSFMITPQDELK
jgi:GNAT superfamily N-acetyltransferase